jgi:endonuclease YncB( thermonuclease family)
MTAYFKTVALALTLALVFFTQLPALAQTTATVDRITDGDTVVLTDGQRIRLACVDAPESKQLWGKAATEKLRSLLPIASLVSVNPVDVDRYGRTVAVLSSGETNVNLEMVRGGYALVYRKYLGNCPDGGDDFLAAEDLAKQQKLKFWSQTAPCEPWNYRRGKCSDKVQNNPKKG